VAAPDLIGTVEAAELIGRSVPHMKRLAASGRVPPALKMPGRTGAYLFDRAVVEAYRDQAEAS